MSVANRKSEKTLKRSRPGGQGWLRLALLILAVGRVSGIIKPCNRDLLTFFNLKGNPVPIETKMLICPNILENCCSVADEVSIYSLWQNFTIPKMDRHIDDMLILYRKILSKHKRIVKLNPKRIEYNHTINKIVMYPLEVCEESLGSIVSPPGRELVQEADTHPVSGGHHQPERILSELGDDDFSMGMGMGMGGSGMNFDEMKMNLKSDYAKNAGGSESSWKDKYKGKSVAEMQAQLMSLEAGGAGGGMDSGHFSSDSISTSEANLDDMKSMMTTMDPGLGKSDFDLSSSTGDPTLDQINHDAKANLDSIDTSKLSDSMSSRGLGGMEEASAMGSMGAMGGMEGMSAMSGMGGMDGTSGMGGMGSMSDMGSFGGSSGLGDMGGASLMSGMGSMSDQPLPPQLNQLNSTLNGITDSSTDENELKAKVEAALAQLSGMTGIDNSLSESKPSETDNSANRKLNMDDSIELDTGKTVETNRISPIQTGPEATLAKAPKKAKDSGLAESERRARQASLKRKARLAEEKRLREERERKRKLQQAQYHRPLDVHLRHMPRHIKCSVTKKKIPKSFKVKNKKKKEFCEEQRKKLEKFPLQDLYDYLENMKPTMRQMIGMKKTFYCSLCDQPKQENVNTQARTITFSVGFCKTLVTEFQDYIKLHNLIFIKYFDAVLQYARCFTTLASENVFPKRSLLKEKMMRVKYISRCFKHAHDPDFMDYCFYLCDQFSYTSLSNFFDGDIDFLKKINFFLLSFMRKFESKQPLTQASLEEPEDLHSINFDDPIYMQEQEKENLLLPPDDAGLPEEEGSEASEQPSKYEYKNFVDVEMDDTEEIYEAKKTKMIFDRFIPKFVDSHKALNPFVLDSHVNFDIDIKNLIDEQCHEDGEEPPEELNRDVLQMYFSINKDDLDDFENDLFLPFADYNFFEMEKKKKKEELEELGVKPKPDPDELHKKALAEYKELRPELGEVDGVTVNRIGDDESEESVN